MVKKPSGARGEESTLSLRRSRANTTVTIDRAWVAAFVGGSVLGLALRLALFLVSALVVPLVGQGSAWIASLVPSLDPVYTHAAQRSLVDLHVQGLAVAGPLGDWLHATVPNLFVASSRAHWAPARIVVESGSPILARLLAAGIAHAGVLGAGLLVVRAGWRRDRPTLVVAGLAMQLQVALGILGAQPSVRELEATGMSFAANALLPWLAPRSVALTDAQTGAWPPLVSAVLVGLALLVGYLPMAVVLVISKRARRLPLTLAATVMLTSAACAGVMRQDAALAVPGDAVASRPAELPPMPAPVSASSLLDGAPAPITAWDRWFVDPDQVLSPQASRVEIVGENYHYQYLVNGEPQVIKGMGLNTQYSQLLSSSDRAARLESDMAELHTMGVNTVLGWDPAEFDGVLLDAAQRHQVGVVMPFELDPEADYTDPAVRQNLHNQVMAWVAQYRGHPALRMWGLGNEVLHKIVHPAWVGPQDPQRQRQAEAFSDWLVETADAIHAVDPDHPVTYRSAEDAFVDWVVAALNRRGGGPRPWFVWGTNCYQKYLSDIVANWPASGMPLALWVSEFAPGGIAVPDRPDGFATMWGYIRQNPDWVLGGAVYAWTRNGPEGVDRTFGLTDDGAPVDGRSLDMLSALFHAE